MNLPGVYFGKGHLLKIKLLYVLYNDVLLKFCDCGVDTSLGGGFFSKRINLPDFYFDNEERFCR
jgi:hypothetical protein